MNKEWFAGKWNIYHMDRWDEDTLHKGGQAYIEIAPNALGWLKFGMIDAKIDGITDYPRKDRMEFCWQGDEVDLFVSGWGWVKKKKDELEGYIKIYTGQDHKFLARKAMDSGRL
ncbi:hypothetical protein C4588_05575 [Candidatus Parcubacteria bacterium]|nr:MAG: hypothetical protein C4588_05575 [Candidatus Parcubacteria bacterium]